MSVSRRPSPSRSRSVSTGVRPPMAILREQGVNGHVEMAAAFDRADLTCPVPRPSQVFAIGIDYVPGIIDDQHVLKPTIRDGQPVAKCVVLIQQDQSICRLFEDHNEVVIAVTVVVGDGAAHAEARVVTRVEPGQRRRIVMHRRTAKAHVEADAMKYGAFYDSRKKEVVEKSIDDDCR